MVLIEKGKESLEKAKNEIHEQYPKVDIKTISFDFSLTNSADYEKLAEQLKGIDIGVLINNIGSFYSGPLHDSDI